MKQSRRDWAGCILFFGLIFGALVLCGCPSELHCPWEEGDPSYAEGDFDKDGVVDHLVYRKADDLGNEFQIWTTGNTFRARYAPAIQPMGARSPSPHALWFAACKFPGGWSEPQIMGEDKDGNDREDEFGPIIWGNLDRETRVTDGYYFYPTSGALRIVRYRSWDDFEKLENGEEIYSGFAFVDLNDLNRIDPPQEQEKLPGEQQCIRRSVVRWPIDMIKLSGPPTWQYLVFVSKRKRFKAGDTIGISGEGIESASVSGCARKEKFGGWCVKEVNWNHALFEATCDAEVNQPFGCFSVTAPQAIEEKVRWLWVGRARGGWGDEVLGPASVDQ